ncbi:MAG: HAMP domain-containing histidine kinase [Ruminococcaceae bacterium]|nr:HAMP domain-containing histidine kinase [Oscillospiraceae bacterium]
MKERERFLKIRGQKIRFSLRTRLTLLIGTVLLCSIAIALGLTKLLEWLIPSVSIVPQWIQLNVFSLVVATAATQYLSKIFFDPIKALNNGMQKVADGDFSVRLETNATSLEIQEMFAGFNMMVKELSSTEILQTDFVSAVSHEFKTPINAIEGYTTLLQSTDNIDEVENEYIEKILFNTKRLSSLVSHILLLSKLENQTIQTNRETYRLDEQLREAILALESAWGPKEMEFDVDLETITYSGNKTLLYHVWSNLLSNAIKFSPDGSTITLRLKTAPHGIVFSVEDQGIGLSEEAQKHLFDKFYQADTSHKSDGNGLGLALVKKIVTLCGGTVSAENRAEGGCRFTVMLHTDIGYTQTVA